MPGTVGNYCLIQRVINKELTMQALTQLIKTNNQKKKR